MKKIKVCIFMCCICLIYFSCSVQKSLSNSIRIKGDVLKEYSQGDEYFMVLQEGNSINKYRIYSKSKGLYYGGGVIKLYSIDTLTQSCYSLQGTNQPIEIDCEKLKKDEDLKEYIKW